MLNARISPILVFGYVCVYTAVKKPNAWGQLAGVRGINTLEASQRLDAKDLTLAYLVGLFDGGGFFEIFRKKNGYISYRMGIMLSIRNVKLLYKIKEILGVGVLEYRENPKDKVFFIIRNKSHLIDFVFPIFDKYPFFSHKRNDYLKFRFIVLSKIVFYRDLRKDTSGKSFTGYSISSNRSLTYEEMDYIPFEQIDLSKLLFYKDLPKDTLPSESLITVESILNAPYFSAWLVGLIEVGGYFKLYKLNKYPAYLQASFEINNTDDKIPMEAIRRFFSKRPNLPLDKSNNFKFKLIGVRSLENVIKFLNKAPVKLVGNKKLHYWLWIKKLRTIPRYAEKIKIPTKY